MIHDSLLAEALQKTTDAPRAVEELSAFIGMQRLLIGAQRRGVRVAPCHRVPVPERFIAEAERREGYGDETGAVFRAYAEALQLRLDTLEMERAG